MSKKIFLYIAVFIPVFMLAILSLAIFFTTKISPSTQDFIYFVAEPLKTRACALKIKAQAYPDIRTDKIRKQTICKDSDYHLYLYNIKKHLSSEISLAEIKRWHLSQKNLSNEGYSIDSFCQSYNPVIWWVWSSPYTHSICLVKDNHQENLNIPLEPPKSSFGFVGWIKNTA